ncbi:ABC transporter substrate-binding protein [Arcanobacterium hippocoleae]|uniref:ABC transporter substrate-binding protein n=1 Tax=Arcanobacterium hippocoleae TaxID=149017 RepID=UPI00333E42AB
MNIRKLAKLTVFVALACTSLTACGKSGTDAVTLEYMTGAGTGTPQHKVLQEISAEFEKENPGVKINLVTGTSNLEEDLKVRLAGKNPPDLWNTHGWSRDRYGEFLEPLNKRTWAEKMKPLGDSLFKTAEGEFYALPYDIQTTGILYNADVLAKAGVDPKGIASWDDFAAAAAKVKENGVAPIVASGKEMSTAGNIADYILPGFYSEADQQKLLAGKFDPDTYAQATALVQSWHDAGYFNPDYTSATIDDVYQIMATAQGAFMFWGNGGLTNIESYNPDAKIGVMPVPGVKRSAYFNAGENQAVGVSKTSAHKEQALKYIDFLAEPKNYTKMNSIAANDSALVGVEPNLGQLTEIYNYWITEQKTPTVPYFDRVYLPNGMWAPMCQTTDGIITGQLDAKAAAEQMQTSFESLYGQKQK